MPWTLYDFVNQRGQNTVADWCRRLQKHDLLRLNQKLDLLEQSGHQLCPGLVGPIHNSRHLYKIKVNGSVAVRLFLCKGPIEMDTEYTLLLGAFEVGDKLPEGTLEAAEQYRLDIVRDQTRRCIHERITIKRKF
jgi:hypothetical protein